jgi:hypothetical protein
LAAIPAAGQFKPEGVPLRAKVGVSSSQPNPSLDAEALGQIAAAARLSASVQRQERVLLTRVSERLRHKNRAGAMQDWEQAIRLMRGRGATPDVDELTNWVLNKAYLEGSPDLKMRAEKVRFYNDQKDAVYASRAELERLRATLRRRNAPTTATIRPVTLNPTFRPGARAVSLGAPKPATIESVVPELQGIVVLCSKADENAEMAQIDLQNALQKQRQTLQTMSNVSNVSKMMHDTAKAIISNMRA